MFSKARPGLASTLDAAKNVLETAYIVEDGVGRAGTMLWWKPWDVDAAPSASESLAVIHSLEGDWPHIPQEAPGPIGGAHLTAIGARILTPLIKWYVNAPLSAGQKIDHYVESLDVVASNGRAGATFYYTPSPPVGPVFYRKFTRQTAVTAAGETALADLSLPGAARILEFIGIAIADGTPTADIEFAGRFIVRSDSMKPVTEHSFDVEPMEAMEATSGVQNIGQITRQECDVTTTVPAINLLSAFDLDVVQTTQTAFAALGATYIKIYESVNPLA